MIVSLPELKEHCRVLHDDEDLKISSFGRAAERIVGQYLCRSVFEPGNLPGEGEAGYDPLQIEATEDIRVVIMQLVHDMYERRGTSGDSEADAALPTSARLILAPYRVFSRVGF